MIDASIGKATIGMVIQSISPTASSKNNGKESSKAPAPTTRVATMLNSRSNIAFLELFSDIQATPQMSKNRANVPSAAIMI